MASKTVTTNIPLAELEPEQGITEQRAATILGVSIHKVRKICATNELDFYTVDNERRIRLGDVFEFQRTHREPDYTKAIKALVDAAPKLSESQREQIAAAFAPGGGGS